MPEGVSAGHPAGQSVHATAVAIAGEALLILGRSRSGKSRLAVALIAASTPNIAIRLLGDDRILLEEVGGRVVARPHPRIAGFIERRGLGLVAMDHVESAPLRGLVLLGAIAPPEVLCAPFPHLRIEAGAPSVPDVLRWWRDASTTPVVKQAASPYGAAKN